MKQLFVFCLFFYFYCQNIYSMDQEQDSGYKSEPDRKKIILAKNRQNTLPRSRPHSLEHTENLDNLIQTVSEPKLIFTTNTRQENEPVDKYALWVLGKRNDVRTQFQLLKYFQKQQHFLHETTNQEVKNFFITYYHTKVTTYSSAAENTEKEVEKTKNETEKLIILNRARKQVRRALRYLADNAQETKEDITTLPQFQQLIELQNRIQDQIEKNSSYGDEQKALEQAQQERKKALKEAHIKELLAQKHLRFAELIDQSVIEAQKVKEQKTKKQKGNFKRSLIKIIRQKKENLDKSNQAVEEAKTRDRSFTILLTDEFLRKKEEEQKEQKEIAQSLLESAANDRRKASDIVAEKNHRRASGNKPKIRITIQGLAEEKIDISPTPKDSNPENDDSSGSEN